MWLINEHIRTCSTLLAVTAAEFTITPNGKPRHPSKPLGHPHRELPLGNQRPGTTKGTRVQGNTHTHTHARCGREARGASAQRSRPASAHVCAFTGGRRSVQGKEGSRGAARLGLAVLTCLRR